MSEIDGPFGKYLLSKTGTRAIQMGHNANEMAFRFVAISWQIYSQGEGAEEKEGLCRRIPQRPRGQ